MKIAALRALALRIDVAPYANWQGMAGLAGFRRKCRNPFSRPIGYSLDLQMGGKSV
jgi:hypothetical protein